MFVFENHADLDADWFLGDKNRNLGRISKKVLPYISNFHLLGIQFLFENFVKKRRGAILNQDEDMNMPLQAAIFLNSVKDEISMESPVLIICPECYLCKWHYHITESGLKSQIITKEDFDPCEIHLLSFDSLKLAEQLINSDLFCVVIDEFDSIATKLIIRKMRGNFNIGLTTRNFYVNPDQKLRWIMLNWASTGCVGKLNDFYSIDRLHSLAFADNYKFWWMRLTWNFCDSFEQPTDQDLQDYHQKLKSWGEIHQIRTDLISKAIKSKRKLLDTKDHTNMKKKLKYEVKNEVVNNSSSNSTSSSETSFHASNIQKNYNKEIKESNIGLFEITDCNKKGASTSLEAEREEEEKETISKQKTETTVNKLVENYSKKQSKEAIEVNERTVSDDILDMFIQSSKNESFSQLDDEPILSIINSQNQESKEISDNFTDVNKLSESSESDSEFLSNIVKNKNKGSLHYRSQQISNVLKNLSDSEESMDNSDGETFFSELISGRKEKCKKNITGNSKSGM